jgi:hypothetical protein
MKHAGVQELPCLQERLHRLVESGGIISMNNVPAA